MKRILWILCPLLIGGFGVSSHPAMAQFMITPSNTLSLSITESGQQAGQLNRAKNLARQAAEKVNGGLNNYRAESSMHGPAAEAPFVDNGDGTVTFTFVGGKPGYTTPSVQTIATVTLATGDVHIDYNGAVR